MNGPPWVDMADQPWTRLTAWLVRLGISISHGRPYHPQTQGKGERFHRTLAAEVLRDRSFSDLLDTQQAFDPWRQVYNTERPHEALSKIECPLQRTLTLSFLCWRTWLEASQPPCDEHQSATVPT